MPKKLILLFCLISTLNSCVRIYYLNDYLFYENKYVVNYDFRFNGYYFSKDTIPELYNYQRNIAQDTVEAYGIRTIILYPNGRAFVNENTIWTGLRYNFHEMLGENSFEAAHRSFQNYLNFYNTKDFSKKKSGIWNWGGYSIDNDEIKIQYFANRIGNYTLIELIGEVTSSSGFLLSSKKEFLIGSKKQKITQINMQFDFFEHSIIPNPSNNYLDNLRIRNLKK
ncbi:MAG: hypothetical protein PHQ65_01915 [Bacteroidales bacterium]|nr:hypothetical protein [Bacteroidales bacterium]MDD3663995.1 hypothetical protein [Bacteroidales bacterium]